MKTVRDVMQSHLVTLEADASALDAAQRMREAAIGDVLVTDDGNLRGILTDRDLVVRCLAQQADPQHTSAGELCSQHLVTVSADDGLDVAADLMKNHAVRRLPVTESGKVVGIVSIGDLALEGDRWSALGGISVAPPNE
ncbi:MAG: CBS domain-containing protein [Pseudomonadales bacterium]